MVKRIIAAAFAAASIILVSSCEEVIDFNGKYDGEKLVLFSCVNPDASRFTVTLSRSRFFLDDSQDERPYDITGGKVTLSVDGKTVNLTEDSRLPGTFHTDLVPQVGSRVVLNAAADDLAPVSCEAVVPERVKCEIVPAETKVVHESEWSVSVEHHFKITLHDDGARKDYYRFIVVREMEGGSDDIDYFGGEDIFNTSFSLLTNDVAFMRSDGFEAAAGVIDGDTASYIDGVYDDSFFNGRDYTFDVWFEDYIPKYEGTYGGDHHEPREYDIHDITGWGIEVDALSEDLYRYQRSRDDYRNSDVGLGSFFGEPVSIHNNIRGGIGCFGAITPTLIMF